MTHPMMIRYHNDALQFNNRFTLALLQKPVIIMSSKQIVFVMTVELLFLHSALKILTLYILHLQEDAHG